MAGEHFEKIGLDLTTMANKEMENKCDFIQNIQSSEEYVENLTQSVGREQAEEIVNNPEIQQLFRDEFDQIKADRTLLREDIMKKKIEAVIPMPVNLPRVIDNILSENKIKPHNISDLDPKHYFSEMNNLMESLCVLPQARLGVEATGIIAEAHSNSMMLFKIFLRRYLCAKKIIC